MNKKNGCVEQLDYIYNECDRVGLKIYLFIDEYDHFTNHILSDAARLDEYKGETHGTGYLRTFFDTIKSAFDTGITPQNSLSLYCPSVVIVIITPIRM